MSVVPIRLWPDPCLSVECAAVQADDPGMPALIRDLLDTMYAAKGRGLAAPQIGVMKRVFVVDVTWKEAKPAPMVFINPQILEHSSDSVVADEQCLSIPALPMPVLRPERVQLAWRRPDGTEARQGFDKAEARCIQHELDHLNGLVIFDHQTPDNRNKLEAVYDA